MLLAALTASLVSPLVAQDEVPANDAGLQDRSWLLPLPAELGETTEGVLYERWNAVDGNSVRNLTRSAKFNTAADEKGLLLSLEPPAQDGKSFGVRMRGYLVAPRSGKMRLVLSSDDNSEFWLSPGSDPFARKRVAWIAGDGRYGYSRPHAAGPSKSQVCAPIDVVEGQAYYFEAYHKERSGDDHFAVQWVFDDETEPAAIPASALRPWSPTSTDADGDGLPDAWQQSTGLTAADEPGSWGDPDHDGVTNFEEYLAGTPPMNGDPVEGFLLWESWYGIEGTGVADLVRSPSFTGDPDAIQYLRGSSTPAIESGNYGSRLSGYIVPKESGSYQLAITGDNSAELWFSASESNFDKERIAFSDRWRKRDQWDASPSQVGKVVTLEAGRAYYVEILHKDEGSPGWVALGWRKEGEEKFAEITPEFLRSPGTANAQARSEMVTALDSSPLQRGTADPAENSVVFTEHGDPDQDGFTNWQEAMNGTAVYTGDEVPGVFTRQWWFNVPGRSLAHAREQGAMLKVPSMTTFSDGSEPDDTTDYFASRLRGAIKAPVTGSYRFWISGDDHCELWLSSNDKKYYKKKIAAVAPEAWESSDAPAWTARGEWDKSGRQESVEITLEAGRSYFVEILHKDGRGNDHVGMAWQHRESGQTAWSERESIPFAALTSHAGEPGDKDDDYLPDDWETQYGLDPQDNGLTDRANQGEAGDFDKDRLTNREEFLLGTNPCAADTDGDGVDDYDELKVYGSNPAVKDASPPVKHADFRLANHGATSGIWIETMDGTLKSMARRGTVDFSFQVDAPGIYLVELKAAALTPDSYAPPIPVIARVDGEEVGRGEVVKGGTVHRWMTPRLDAGTHTVTIDNRNVRAGLFLEISALSIYRHEGTDSNADSIPDWMASLFERLNGLQAHSVESATSPLCLEGIERLPGTTAIEVESGSIEAQPGIKGAWFANVPLLSAEDTPVTITYENGSIGKEETLVWKDTNLFEAPDTLKVRVGDSLKLVAVPAGSDGQDSTASYSLDGVVLGESQAASGKVVSFQEEGTFTLAAATTGPEQLSASVKVEVLAADFGPSFSLASGLPRVWKLPEVPKSLALESDADLSLEEIPRPGNLSRRVFADYTEGKSGSPRVLARLWDGGPVVAATTVNAFRVVGSADTLEAWHLTTLPDGTKVLEFRIVIDGPVPADLSIWLDFYVTDALFENGDSRYQLTAADFDENGEARLTVYKAPGQGTPAICHWIRPYDGESADDPDEAPAEVEAPEEE